MRRKKKKQGKHVFLVSFLLGVVFLFFLWNWKIVINVPLEDQNSGEVLGNGCEVAALSMLLQYHSFPVNKNQLASLLDYVPLKYDNGEYGNPHDGFVGDINGGNYAMGVSVEPIERVAKKIVGDTKKIYAGNQISFKEVIGQVKRGNPVWVITTVTILMAIKIDPFPKSNLKLFIN